MIKVSDHYWIIGGSATDVYSSKTNTMVPVSDADYTAWLAYETPTQIPDEQDLAGALQANCTQLPAWLFNAPSFIQPATGEYDVGQLKAYSADARWRKEQGGITTTAGFPIRTDDRAQAKITGTYTAQKEVPSVTTSWHDVNGTVHLLDAAGLYQLHVDLLTHINACFAVSAANIDGIDGGTITTLEQIDASYAAAMTDAQKTWMQTT